MEFRWFSILPQGSYVANTAINLHYLALTCIFFKFCQEKINAELQEDFGAVAILLKANHNLFSWDSFPDTYVKEFQR